ncbi:uncharacterized protein LW93_9172 [Fusarium fujikuroi]|nr:uncharacterized protein LW93_9172 [Fusarium fujikuroi]
MAASPDYQSVLSSRHSTVLGDSAIVDLRHLGYRFIPVVVSAHHDVAYRTPTATRLADRLHSPGTNRDILIDQSKFKTDTLTEGAHFDTATGLLPVREGFPVTHAAFVASLVQSLYQTVIYLNATNSDAYTSQAIAVPSRLYFTPNPELSLNSPRVGIKDSIDIAGAKTFDSSLAYGAFHGITSQNAPAIQRLLDLVAVIIGKTGMSQLADTEIPHMALSTFTLPHDVDIRSPRERSTGGSVRQLAASH